MSARDNGGTTESMQLYGQVSKGGRKKLRNYFSSLAFFQVSFLFLSTILQGIYPMIHKLKFQIFFFLSTLLFSYLYFCFYFSLFFIHLSKWFLILQIIPTWSFPFNLYEEDHIAIIWKIRYWSKIVTILGYFFTKQGTILK